MDEGTQTTTPAPAEAEPGVSIAPIQFKGRTIQTYLPNEAQVAVIARLTFMDPNSRDVNRLRTHINRVGALLAGLMVRQEDWDFVEDGMAARTITWDEVLGIFSLISEAHGLTNRADRRAGKGGKSGKGKARRG